MRLRSKEGKLTNLDPTWFSIPKPRPEAGFQLFCFPYAGGMPEIYYSWLSELSEDVELIAVQYPGHIPGSKDKLYTNLKQLAMDVSEIIAFEADKKFAFFGHSMGALIAYEIALQLREREAVLPRHLFLAARNPPHIRPVQPRIHTMTTNEIIKVAMAFNALPEEVLNNEVLLKLIIPIMKADFEMIETWEVDTEKPPLPIPIHVFAGTHDAIGSPQNMKEWVQYSDVEFCSTDIRGQHYFILDKDLRTQVIKIVEQVLFRDVAPIQSK